MDLRIHLLNQVNFVMFLYFTYCHSVASDPVKQNMLEAIAACDSVKFLRNSSYISECSVLSYPVDLAKFETEKDLNLMCMTLNHITNKICEYHIGNKSQIKIPETADKFDEEVKKLEPKSENRIEFVGGWCKNTTLFFNVSIQNDTNVSYIKYAKEILLDKTECIETCQIRRGVNRFCMVFFWFNKLYNALESSKNLNTSKESAAVPRQESLSKSISIDNLGKQDVTGDNNNNEHTRIATSKSYKELPKSKIPDPGIEIPKNLKADPIGTANEQEIKKNVEQSEIYDREQKQDSKVPSSTDDKLNIAESNNENLKPELQEGNDDFMDDERKKTIEEGAEGENDHDIMETNKKDSFSDSGDQRSFLESSVIKEEEESHFFMYFSIISFACVMLYIGYHNKQKILAIVLEGRQSRRGRSSRRRPNTANYRKLDSNLEEAVTSQCNSNVTHVIY